MSKKQNHNREYPPIEDICEKIIDGWNWRKISEFYNIPLGTLHSFCSRPLNIPHVRLALDMSAATIADKAEHALLNAERTIPGVGIARELAQYYKWLAAKRSPRTFGEKQEIDYTTTVKTIKVTVPDEPQLEQKVKSYVTTNGTVQQHLKVEEPETLGCRSCGSAPCTCSDQESENTQD